MSDSFSNFHDYEIRWTPEKIEWLIDGKIGRSLKKEETWNATSKNYMYPQTPARVQLSIWPGGKETNAKGTIDWAGGVIDWDAEDIQNNGYFYATFSEVDIECYNADSAPGTNKGNAYWYNDVRATNDTIVDGDRKHVLASLQGTGTDLDKGKKKSTTSSASSSKTSTKDDDDKAKETKTGKDDEAEETEVASIPGGGTVSPGNDHSGDDSSSNSGSSSGSGSSGSSSGSSDSSSDDTEQADTTNCDTTSFNQDCSSGSSSSSKSEDGGSNSGTRNGASALAIIIAGCALYWL